jgi:hypothetical protein
LVVAANSGREAVCSVWLKMADTARSLAADMRRCQPSPTLSSSVSKRSGVIVAGVSRSGRSPVSRSPPSTFTCKLSRQVGAHSKKPR